MSLLTHCPGGTPRNHSWCTLQPTAHPAFLTKVRDRLEQAQQKYKNTYDKNHRVLEFAVRDWV
jgi:hypothetical protein